jgi:N-acyl-D-aspartate/D-glutamate deacylase
MYDLIIKAGKIYDGSGGESITADIAVKEGKIVEIGRINSLTKEKFSADGAIVTPGFVDIHTHYDGQATWDETFSPSVYHGVTTVVMGNCGVGFAPVRKGSEERLINLMEGVEDIPGSALSEGIRWNWETFPEYMNYLDSLPHTIDFLTLVPHDVLRIFVMGERGEALEDAQENDIQQMKTLLIEAIAAGAIGFSTGRTDNHRTAEGKATPASEATKRELTEIAQAFQYFNYGVVQLVSDFDLLVSPQHFDAEFELVEALAESAKRRLSMTWLEREPGREQWKQIQKRTEQANSKGLEIYLQTATRGIGIITGLETNLHPFSGFPTFKSFSNLPLAEIARRMRENEIKQKILSEKPERLAGDGSSIPPIVDIILTQIEMLSVRMFPLTDEVNYEPVVTDSFYFKAKTKGIKAIEAIYDYLSEGDGTNLIYFPIFNYATNSLDTVWEMLNHPHALVGLSDGGAHVATICDASYSTTLLSYWTRDRKQSEKISLERAVEMLTSRNARYLGLKDRGEIKVGMKADINVIEFEKLRALQPELKRDLPAGGKRFVQQAEGYVATFVNGKAITDFGKITDNRPGRLVRVKSETTSTNSK